MLKLAEKITNGQLLFIALMFTRLLSIQGLIQRWNFLKGGLKSEVDAVGRGYPSIIFLKQGVWGYSFPEAMRYLILCNTKIPYNVSLECFQAFLKVN